MKQKIPIAAISFQDMIDDDPSKFPDLLSDRSLIDDLTVDLEDIASDVAYILVLNDNLHKMSYPVYAKRYEVVISQKKKSKKKDYIKYRKIAEYDHNSFEIQIDNDNFPTDIVVETVVN